MAEVNPEELGMPITLPGEWTVVEGEQFSFEDRKRILAKLDAIDEAQARARVSSQFYVVYGRLSDKERE